MKIEKIFFDLDGVLADFNRGVKELCGMEPIDQMNKTEAQDDALFLAIRNTPHFYARLEPIPGSIEMFRRVYERFGDRCEILSGVPSERRGISTASEDKLEWVRKHLGKDVKVNLVKRKDKALYCTGTNAILVDDYERNIKEWEAVGGTGLLFSDADTTIRRIDDLAD